jgi:hypothetical protein
MKEITSKTEEDNIKLDLKEIGLEIAGGLIWLKPWQLASFFEGVDEPSVSIKCGKFIA